MRGRVVSALVLALLAVVAGAAFGDPGPAVGDKQRIDAQIEALRADVARANALEGVLTSQLSTVTAQLRAAQAAVGDQEARLSALEMSLAAARVRLRDATFVVTEKTAFLRFIQRQEQIARHRLDQRLREIYKHERPDTLSVFLSATSFSQALDDVDYAKRLGQQDRRVAVAVAHARAEAARAELAANRARRAAAALARELASRVHVARAARDRLAASRDTVAAVRRVKAQALAAAHEDRQAYLEEVRGLEAQSAALAERIRVAQASSGYRPAGGAPGSLQWPVSGPVTSPFGVRWGRMHEGIDIAVPAGTPVHAAGAGRVVYAGWMEGYGNLVVLDHGAGLSTAYGHNTGVAVAVGQDVAAGAVVAYAGSTGHSTGPHVHFEVRVNGEPVDPLSYL